MTAVAWALNLEADEELRRPGYAPSAKMLARVEAMIGRIAGLVAPGDVVLARAPRRLVGFVGRAWCPTPRALAWLAKAGIALPAAPAFEVIREANHRRFSAALGQHLDGAIFTADRRLIEARLRTPTPSGSWLLKRPFGFGGAGRRRVRVGGVDEDLDRWLTASLREDGLQVEPFVERELDCALHGHLADTLVLGRPTLQRCDAHGAWVATEPMPEGLLSPGERRALHEEAERAAEALVRLGYFGPFGIDAFRYRAGRFNPRCEINARYSMGWAVGMPERPDRRNLGG